MLNSLLLVMAGVEGIGSTLIALLERGVTAGENGFASLIDVGG